MAQFPAGQPGSRGLAPFARAAGVGAATLLALRYLPQFPVGIAAILVVLAALATLVSTKAGIVCYVLVIGVPIFYANPVLGVVFVVAGLVAMPLLVLHEGVPFFLLSGTVLAAAVHAEWAIPVLAGLYLGTGEAVAVGIVAAIGVELAGSLSGHRFVGTMFANGATPLLKLDAARMPLSGGLGWISARYGAMPVWRLGAEIFRSFTTIAMILQPPLWGGAAAVAASLEKTEWKRMLGAAAGGLGLLFVGQAMIVRLPGPPVLGGGELVATLAGSVAVTAVVIGLATFVDERWGAALPVTYYSQAPVAEQVPQESDVVDLLRTISRAEEQIRDEFTQNATILLSDMKEFSRITHEQGSIPSAKTVQSHRDLLMPIIEHSGGTAKATGGDGIMAAFQDARSAIQAAVDMQRAVTQYNGQATADTQVMIRIGVNTGEVVFDKEGTPFVGDGVNTCARVMALADGGQILIDKSALEEAIEMGDFRWQYLGTHDLKGVAVGAHIYEILWHDGQVEPVPEPPQTV